MPNRRLAASAPAKKSVTRTKIARSACQWKTENRNGHYAPAERCKRDHEILTVAPTAGSQRSIPLRNSARVCTHQQYMVAPYGRYAGDLQSVQILDLIQLAVFRLLGANVLVVLQFCMRLAAVTGEGLREARRVI